jgi:hypothetical protein
VKRTPVFSTSDLSPEERSLLALIRRVQFGRIERLHVIDGGPVFQPSPLLVITRKLNEVVGPPEVRPDCEYALKQEFRHLFDQFRSAKRIVIRRIEIRNCLPIHFEAEIELTEHDPDWQSHGGRSDV